MSHSTPIRGWLRVLIFSVVFVHGLTGNRTCTLSHDGLLWPRALLPNTLPNARIMTFGYDADVLNMWSTAGQNRIGHHGSSLARSLADFRDRTDMVRRRSVTFTSKITNLIICQSNTPIIFVAHSLGGLVCESVSFSRILYQLSCELLPLTKQGNFGV